MKAQCDLVFVPGLVSHLDLQRQQLSYRRFVTALEHACRVIRFELSADDFASACLLQHES